MEITNEERREVAGRIRERICRNHRAAWDVVLELSYIDVFGDRFRMNKEFTLFLADLIDRPTTTVTVDSGDDDSDLCIKCNSCCRGWHISKYDKSFSYCPECGAEVVE